MKKILIIQGGAWGDCINSTLMLKPIKDHFAHDGGCEIHVVTSDLYASAFYNNPLISELIIVPVVNKLEAINLVQRADHYKEQGYDLVIANHPMYRRDMWVTKHNPEGERNIINTWIHSLEELGIDVSEPQSLLYLSSFETEIAAMRAHELDSGRPRVLMEVLGESGQTPWNSEWTRRITRHLVNRNIDVLISCHVQTRDIIELREQFPFHVHWVGDLSLRECAGLYNYVKGFIGVSSGLTNACNTQACRQDIPWFEVVLNRDSASWPIRETGKVILAGCSIRALEDQLLQFNPVGSHEASRQ